MWRANRINAGRLSNVRVGDEFTVFGLGEKLYDPDTGQLLGQRETRGARLRVTGVQEKLAVCRVVSGPSPRAGDALRKGESRERSAGG